MARVNVEESFNDFVREIGGEIVSELLPKSPQINNADYIFREALTEPVVAELKCLTEDLNEIGYQEKLEDLHREWVRDGLVCERPLGNFLLRSNQLPRCCQHAWLELLKGPIKKAVQKANRQIKQTKRHFGLMGAKGLLVLVHNGNYSLDPSTVLYLVDRVLGSRHSGISSVVYVNVNMNATMPSTERNVLFWIQANRAGIPGVSKEFLNALHKGWKGFYERAIGEPVPTIDQGSIDQIKFKRP